MASSDPLPPLMTVARRERVASSGSGIVDVEAPEASSRLASAVIRLVSTAGCFARAAATAGHSSTNVT